MPVKFDSLKCDWCDHEEEYNDVYISSFIHYWLFSWQNLDGYRMLHCWCSAECQEKWLRRDAEMKVKLKRIRESV